MGRKVQEYAVYKGDNLVAMGTAKECAEHLGVTPKYIQWLSTPSGKRRMESRKKPYKNTSVVRLN